MKENKINRIISEAIDNWIADREPSEDFKRGIDFWAKRNKEINDKITYVKNEFGNEDTEFTVSEKYMIKTINVKQKLNDGLYIKNLGLHNTYYIEQFSPFGAGSITWGDSRGRDGKMPEFKTYDEYLEFFKRYYHSIIGNHKYGWWETNVIDRDELRRKYPHGCQVFDDCKKALNQWFDE
jgi:hypothetical protein